MKKSFLLILLCFVVGIQAQQTANRFFYELTYAPNKDSISKTQKTMTILDITKDKSIYRDYLMVSQDSILKIEVEAMQKSGTFKDLSKSIKQPKFAHKISKAYPSMEVTYSEQILQDIVSYKETENFNWNIGTEKKKIGAYEAQKATTEFGGRKWTAWFSSNLPFQDGPYKFFGLPGLIVQIGDDQGNYSWTLQGNKKVENYEEQSYSESLMKKFGQGIKDLNVNRERFETIYDAYKKDPFGSIRSQIAQIPAEAKMPDGTRIADMLRDQEERLKKYLNENSNSIELTAPAPAKGKKK